MSYLVLSLSIIFYIFFVLYFNICHGFHTLLLTNGKPAAVGHPHSLSLLFTLLLVVLFKGECHWIKVKMKTTHVTLIPVWFSNRGLVLRKSAGFDRSRRTVADAAIQPENQSDCGTGKELMLWCVGQPLQMPVSGIKSGNSVLIQMNFQEFCLMISSGGESVQFLYK